MKITKDSHLDHSLTPAHVALLVEEFGAHEGFALRTVTLPPGLPSLPCALHGPIVGDDPVPDSEAVLRARGGRPGASRLCPRPSRPSRLMTVIVGPHEGETILYTAFGGPAAPREPHDPSLSAEELAESRAFWAEHALSED